MSQPNPGNLFLTDDQQETLNGLVKQWKEAVEARTTGNSLEIANQDEDLSVQELENPNPYFSEDEDEEDVQFFSLDTSEKADSLRSLNEWANRALRSAKILRQAISKNIPLAPEKQKNLLNELKPPQTPETAKIPILTKEQLQNDSVVFKYVTALKRHRFRWRKHLTSQKRRLRSGFGL